MKIKCNWDRTSQVITGICLLLTLYLLYIGVQKGGADLIICAIISTLLYSIFLFRPKYLILQDEKLTLHMPLHTKTFDFKEYEIVTNLSLKGSFRAFATGGFAGYMGIYYCSEIGFFMSYLTTKEHITILRHKESNKIVLVNHLTP